MERLARNLIWGTALAGSGMGLAAAIRRYQEKLGAERARSHDAQSQTIAALQMRDHLMASASHDLKSPLASIRLLVHVLKRDAAKTAVDPGQLLERLELIDRNVNKMSSLINEMLDVARLQGGHPVELHPSETDLVALAWRVASAFGVEGQRQRVSVNADVPNLIGWWDADRLERLLSNLVANSLKYSPEGGEVTLAVSRGHSRTGDVAQVEIGDHGIGIPAEDLPRVFDWFYRGHNVRERAGTGVGLASAKMIIEKHGGAISVKSRLGRGTTVSIQLPMTADARQREEVQGQPATPEATERSSQDRE